MRLFGGNPRFAAKRSPAGGDPAPKEKSASGQMQCRTLYGALAMIVLSCALFVGTTFAWFTDQSTGATARIMGGKLSVELVFDDPSAVPAGCSLENIIMTRTAPSNSGSDVWNPEDTFASPFMHVENTGDLPLKYKLSLKPDSSLEGVIHFQIECSQGGTFPDDVQTLEAANGGNPTRGTSFRIVGTMCSSDMEFSGTALADPFELTVVAYQNEAPWPSPTPDGST